MDSQEARVGFHYQAEAQAAVRDETATLFTVRRVSDFTYKFLDFFHPHVGELIKRLNRESLRGLLDPSFHESLTGDFFAESYKAFTDDRVGVLHLPEKLDLDEGGPYAVYNWELLFHIPLTIAVHLSKNQRFAEAQRWFHFIFDPTCNDTSVEPPRRFWKFLRFREEKSKPIDELLALLSRPETEVDAADLKLRSAILDGYAAIQEKPFQPHAVARTRIIAYQYTVVMKYLDNLIAWGDSLFRQDTVESINEATQRYVLAANLLGPRPQRIPPAGTIQPKTFDQLKKRGLDPMGNALVELEAQFPFNIALPRMRTSTGANRNGPLLGIGRTLYFCIPRNDKLLTYWDTVGDRLFKIRHCMNIEGVVRQLALFDPPLDPGMLVKAAAAGIDIGSIVSGLNQPIGPVRSLLLIQKALELCGEVRGLGNALLAAIEKGDGEHLARLRQTHEIRIQQASQEVRFLQWKQAEEATQGLLRSRASALERYRYYQRLLGVPPDPNLTPDTFPLDRRELNEESFDEAYSALVETYDKALPLQTLGDLRLAGDSSPSILSGFSGNGKVYLSANEDKELNTHLPAARDARLVASAANLVASSLTPIPSINVHGHFWGLGVSSEVTRGEKIAAISKFVAEIALIVAAWEQDQAGMASRYAGYERRADEWILQHNLAARELMQIGRQIIASLIAEQVAHREYLNIQKQIAQSQEVDRFLHEKLSNEELYGWMQGEISRLYYEYYRFAFDTARKAERTMKQELMRPELDATDFVKFNYWDGGRKGLLSGEALYLDVKRMEMAFHENNKRELEITRHVSLRQLDPLALLSLRVTGTCKVSIPEWLYDLDCPGHYMRRIKSVALSLPAVTGPYTGVHCTLSLLGSSVRKSPLPGDSYGHDDNDELFVHYLGAVQSIVTSGGVNDSGMFETNLRDERFLPFEGAGAISSWRIELPKDVRQFDYQTISDVILHIRYTARPGGNTLAEKAVTFLQDEVLAKAEQSGLALLLSLRHDFPTEWAAFANTGKLTVPLRQAHFPYLVQSAMTQGKELKVEALELHVPQDQEIKQKTIDVPGSLNDTLKEDGSFTLELKENGVFQSSAEHVFLVVRYSVT